jgi:hypothetical protein
MLNTAPEAVEVPVAKASRPVEFDTRGWRFIDARRA